MSLKSKLKSGAIDVVVHLDKAIELGIKSAYPLVFNIPPPDEFNWKHAVGLGWKLVKTTAKETAFVITKQWREK